MNIRDLLVGEWYILPVPKDGRGCTILGDNGRKITVVASIDPLIGLMITARFHKETHGQVEHVSTLSPDEKMKVLACIKNPGRLREYGSARWLDVSVAEVLRDLKN